MPIKKSKVISTSEWIIINFIMLIPLVNIIMLFVWAFRDKNETKSNWAKASLIVWVIGFIFYLIIIILSITFIMNFLTNVFGTGIHI